MILVNDISRFFKDWLLYSIFFLIINFILSLGEEPGPGPGPGPYFLIIFIVAVGVLLAFIVTRCRVLVEAWIFRGLLACFMLLSVWLPGYLGVSELEQWLLLIGGITFGTTSAGYKTDFTNRKD